MWAMKKTQIIGKWILTKVYERTMDHGIERLKIITWEVKRRGSMDATKEVFYSQKDTLNYILEEE